jgi:demethylmenaquinone methyltransferase/2-methoxy-6-polyprenyl-1,4-benzoquinol methylase
MSSLALMRWLEATPERYDAGMRVVTLGRVTALHEAVAAAATPVPEAEVLEIGCGTGAVTQRLLKRGAGVTALDQNPDMLEQARRRLGEPSSGEVTWLERTAAEIDALPAGAFDAVVLSLSLSEMSGAERRYVLAQARARLRPGGRVVAADEVRSEGFARRAAQRAARAPQWLLGWLLAGSVSSPLADLRAELEAAGLVVQHEQRWLLGTLALFVSAAAEEEACARS